MLLREEVDVSNLPAEVLDVLKRFFGASSCHETPTQQHERRFSFTGQVAGFLYHNGVGWHVVVEPEELTKSKAREADGTEKEWVFVQYEANRELQQVTP